METLKKVLEASEKVLETLEEVSGSEAVSMKLWRAARSFGG